LRPSHPSHPSHPPPPTTTPISTHATHRTHTHSIHNHNPPKHHDHELAVSSLSRSRSRTPTSSHLTRGVVMSGGGDGGGGGGEDDPWAGHDVTAGDPGVKQHQQRQRHPPRSPRKSTPSTPRTRALYPVHTGTPRRNSGANRSESLDRETATAAAEAMTTSTKDPEAEWEGWDTDVWLMEMRMGSFTRSVVSGPFEPHEKHGERSGSGGMGLCWLRVGFSWLKSRVLILI
jgi:hypothetical protein